MARGAGVENSSEGGAVIISGHTDALNKLIRANYSHYTITPDQAADLVNDHNNGIIALDTGVYCALVFLSRHPEKQICQGKIVDSSQVKASKEKARKKEKKNKRPSRWETTDRQ